MRYGRLLATALLGLAASFAVFAAALVSIYRDAKADAIRDLNQQQFAHARQAARGIRDRMEKFLGTLDFLASCPSVVAMNGEGRQMLTYFARSGGGEIRSVTRVNAEGSIIDSVPFSPGTKGSDISGQEHVREILRTHKPVVSDVFTAVQGFRAVAVHVPVFDGPKFDGTLAFLLSFDAIAGRYIEDIRIGETGYAWVVSRKGYEISCPVPGHVGRSVFETSKDFPEILAMAHEMLQGKEGVAAYHFDAVRGTRTTQVLKYAVYLPVTLGNTFWSIVVATPEAEMMASLHALRLKMGLVAAAMLAACAGGVFLLVRGGIVAREERKREAMRRALEKSEALYRALIETTGTGFVVIDGAGRVVEANQEYVRLTGHRTLDEIRGRSVVEWTAAHEKEKNREATEQCLKDRLLRNLEIDYAAADGTVHSVEINATVVEEDGDSRILALCRDITARKRLESQLVQAQKMESVGRLAGGVAHDFNNMLSVITGYAEMALMAVRPEDGVNAFLQEILKAAQRSAELTKQLLAFARRQVASPRQLDLNQVVSGMLKMLQRLIGEDISLAWLPGQGLWTVRMDPSQVDQILANLLINARDAVNGTGTITIETANQVVDAAFCARHLGSRQGEYVGLTVRDSGRGMSQETLSHVFEPFFTTKGVGKGTGLGLATVYGIIEQNGGFIDLWSEPGAGSIFRLYLPRFAGAGAEPDAETPPRPVRGGSETILLVEDDPAVLGLGTSMLESLGYKVLAAPSPSKALELAQNEPNRIDLVLADVVMPEMNGKKLMERLSGDRPDLKCVFMSGYTADIIAYRGILEEGVAFLQKPFTIRALAEKLRELLDPPRAPSA